MKIVSINTTHVTTQPFANLIETGEFVPYYQTVIRYTDPREGERAERVYSATGQGQTEYASEQDAIDTLRAHTDKSRDAYNDYLNSQGVHFVDC